jgi:hypothetical protein
MKNEEQILGTRSPLVFAFLNFCILHFAICNLHWPQVASIHAATFSQTPHMIGCLFYMHRKPNRLGARARDSVLYVARND